MYQILKKKIFTNFFLVYDICENRQTLIKKSIIELTRPNIAQMKENKNFFPKMKKIRGGGGGRNRVKFHFEVSSKFSNRKKKITR